MGVRIQTHLPRYYEKSELLTGILDGINAALDSLWTYYSDKVSQTLPASATDEGLRRWESDLGLIIAPTGKSIDERRAIVIGKIMRTMKTVPATIKEVVDRVTGGNVVVYEYPEEYRFSVRFIGGVYNPKEGAAAVREMKPAHLTFDLIFNTHADLGHGPTAYPSRAFSHDELSALTHDRIQLIDLTEIE